jgi:hypothetical protein
MKRRGYAGLLFVAAIAGFSSIAGAAVAPKTIVPVFRVDFEPEDKYRYFIFTDVSDSTPGQEVLALSYSCTRSAPDANGNVRTTGRARFTYRPATGGAAVFAPNPLPTVTTGPYPDPNDPDNQCGGINHTEFDEGDFQNTQQKGCPLGEAPYQGNSFDPAGGDEGLCNAGVRAQHFMAGVAHGAESTKYLVFSDAVTGTYRNESTGFNDVDITTFAIHVYNMNGSRAWTKTFGMVNPTFGRLEPVLSGVGDFLEDNAGDELRVARIKDGSSTFYYWYYNITTGAQIGTTVSASPNP